MNKRDEILEIETLKWREKSYDQLAEMLPSVACYEQEYKGSNYLFEIHMKINEKSKELTVMVECCKKSIIGSLVGKSNYFVKGQNNIARAINDDEAF